MARADGAGADTPQAPPAGLSTTVAGGQGLGLNPKARVYLLTLSRQSK